MKLAASIQNDLFIINELVYEKCDFVLTDLKAEAESVEYAACRFLLDGKSVVHRASKITPTKTGQFVTTWKRNANGLTAPFDNSDDIDLLIITARNGEKFGQFIFPKSILLTKGIFSENNKGGKRGTRVYPSWDIATNKQAEKTQKWQAEYFLEIFNRPADIDRAKKLLSGE